MIFSGLINNIALIISLSIFYSFIIRRWKYGSRIGQVISGFLFGAVAVVGMMNPLIISPGLIFDGRSIIISIAGFLGGWVTGLIAALMGIIYRAWLGGPGGIMGVSVIASSAAIGIAYHYIRRRRPHVVTPLYLIGFGLIVHVCMLALTMTLPSSMKYEVLSNIAIPVILIYPIGTLLVCIAFLDLESRKRAEETLRENEERFRILAETIEEVFWMADIEIERIFYISPGYEQVWGQSRQNLYDNPKSFIEAIHPADRERVLADLEVQKTGQPFYHEYRIIRPNGSIRWIWDRGFPVKSETGGVSCYVGVANDITERRLAEERLSQSEEKFRNLFNNAEVGIFRSKLDGSEVLEVNRKFLDIVGMTLEETLGKPSVNLWADPKEREEMVKRLVADGSVQAFEYKMLNKRQGDVRDCLTSLRLYREQGILEGSILDITERKREEEQLKQTLNSLRRAFGTTIQVMVSAIETRDPYTAGHQLRSADLARAIATEMGLSHEKIEGIRMAGSIHDIGKLSIPAEILSKPTKLTEIEFALIKQHPQRGYEILKDVESPWPLAQIVYQHHERMDGSGYPRSLRGNDILMEARILAVADVVEAIASHRPYRPALGIEKALEEISQNRGILYDSEVVDACLRLFKEKGFKLE